MTTTATIEARTPQPPNGTPAPKPDIVGVNVAWEQRGPFQRNWTTSAVQVTDAAGKVKVSASADTNGLFTNDPEFDQGDRYDVAVAGAAVDFVRERSSALTAALGGSNVTEKQWASNTVRPGEYALALWGKGEKELYYVGLLKSAPQPVTDLIEGMKTLRERL